MTQKLVLVRSFPVGTDISFMATSFNVGSILDVLSDPSFEHNQPSWVRRSLRVAPHAVRRGLPFTSFAVAAAQLSSEAGGGGGVGGVGVEEVDFAQEDVVTEFVSEEEEKGAKVSCICTTCT